MLHSRYTYGGVDLRARRSANEELHDLAINNADHGHQAHPELHEGRLHKIFLIKKDKMLQII